MENKTKTQLFWLVTLRVAIGWHFLYEGLVKLSNPNWSSFGYLMDSKGIFENLFHTLASSSGSLVAVDFLNVWGLIAIGLLLILGFLSRPAIIAAITLLGFYYLSHPACIGLDYSLPTNGSFFIIDKTLIELFALAVLYVFPSSKEIGIDKLIFNRKQKINS